MNDVSAAEHEPAKEPGSFRALLIWPAVVLLASLWGLRILPGFYPEASMPVAMARFIGPLVCAGLILLWWLFLSRATLGEKALGLVGLVAIVFTTTQLSDKSVRGFGTMIHAIPWGTTAFTVALIVVARMQPPRRVWLALLAAVVGFGYWDLVRTDAIWGDFKSAHNWRWEPTAEDRFLETLAARPAQDQPPAASAESLVDPEWPAFRGPHRDGVQPGIVLAEDWQAQPPEELWRVAVGPGWSSFSVAGSRLFTQEQRGDDEVIVCYDAESGAELWVHSYESRFWEVVGGTGPRATPTLDSGKLFSLGANGSLHCLNAATGELIWQQDIASDADRKPPMWGFASSPLVTGGLALVHAGGKEKGLLAYDAETGELRWSVPAGGHSYSSPQLAEIHGQTCVLMLTDDGLTIVDPTDGTLLGNHEWKYEGYRVVQPLVVDDASVLLGTGMGTGTQRVALTTNDDKFTATKTWTSRRMNPYYNDYVAHNGYLYGFDNNIFACLDLSTGQRKWKKGRYGNGQVLLLPEGDQLLVISEDGELVLLRATPEKLVELAKQPVLEGRTWNHPVLVGDRLYVRNGEEAACFRMPVAQETEI